PRLAPRTPPVGRACPDKPDLGAGCDPGHTPERRPVGQTENELPLRVAFDRERSPSTRLLARSSRGVSLRTGLMASHMMSSTENHDAAPPVAHSPPTALVVLLDEQSVRATGHPAPSPIARFDVVGHLGRNGTPHGPGPSPDVED